LPIVIALAAATVAALIAGNAKSEPVRAVASASDAATLAPAGARSNAWFCPGLPTTLPLDAQTLSISNVDDKAADAIVTVYPDDGSTAVTQTVSVPGNGVNVIGRATLGPPGGVVIEAFSRGVVVEHGIESASQLALEPCASHANTEWFFAAATTGNFEPGTTGRPVEDWLTLFNPFGTDARAQVTLRTNEAVPEVLETIDVPRRMRVVVPIHERTVRKPQVSVEVHATSGRVVATQAMVFGEAAGYTGVTLSLGAMAPAPAWTFAEGVAAAGSRTVIALVNPGLVDTQVDVTVSTATVPLTVPVKRDAVVWVQIGGCGEPPAENCVPVPPESGYAATVSSDVDKPIVAEQLDFSSSSATGNGISTLMGVPHGARGAVFARAAVGQGRTSVLALTNPGTRAVRADVQIARGGTAEQPSSLRAVEVPPGQRVAFDLSALLGAGDAAVVIRATGPIVANRSVSSSGDLTRSAAIVGVP
jgi:hypothetical protein